MKERDVKTIKKFILQKLVRANIWGGKHTLLNFVVRGVPEHYKNTHQGKKTIEKALKELTNDGWIVVLAKRTGKGSGEHVSLNPRKVSEIKQFIESTVENGISNK